MMKRYIRWLLILFFLLPIGVVSAATLIQQDAYLLPEDEVFEGDLYGFAADSVTIDGVDQGDLVVLSTNLQISGQVEGDVLAAVVGAQIHGRVQDDVRLVAASVNIDGQIEGDLATTGAGNTSFDPMPISVGTRLYDQGVLIKDEARIGGDLLVNAGLVRIVGEIGGRLQGTVTALDLDTAHIEGGADITIAGDIRLDEESVVGGDGFAYAAVTPLNVRSNLSETIHYTPVETDSTIDLLTTIRQIAGQLVIFAVLGWVLLRYMLRPLLLSVAALNTRFSYLLWTSVLVLLGVPFFTLAIMIVFSFFLSIGPMIALVGFVAFTYGMLWAFAPLLVGLWLGQRFSNQAYTGLIIGTSLLVVLRQVPGFGFIISSMIATVGLAGIIGSFFVVVQEQPPIGDAD